jgi:predicted MFS family arabinose efflux permease
MGPTAFLGVYLVDVHGLSVAAAGVALGALSAARLFGNRVGARFADRLGARRAVAAGLVGMAAGYALLGIPGLPLGLAFAALAFTGATFQAGYPSQVVLVTSLVPAARGGTAAAANTGLFYLGATMGPALVGLVVGAAGAGAVGWLGLVGALMGLVLARAAQAQSRASTKSSP